MRFVVSTKNEILLFSIFGSFEKIFLLKIFSKIQSNAFSLPFSIFSKNKNRKTLILLRAIFHALMKMPTHAKLSQTRVQTTSKYNHKLYKSYFKLKLLKCLFCSSVKSDKDGHPHHETLIAKN